MITPPIIAEDVGLDRFNPLFAHLYSALAKSQSMSALEVIPSDGRTVTRILESTFPAIKAADDEPTPLVSKHTVGYIHALMIDSLTLLSTEQPRGRALRNETMVVEELEANKDVFRTELRDCLVDYYETILKMDGAGGIPRSTRFKRKFNSTVTSKADAADAADADADADSNAAAAAGGGGGPGVDGCGGGGGDDDDNADANASPTPPPPAAAAAAEEAAEAGKGKGRGRAAAKAGKNT